jgi:hypothetical protein
MRLTAFSARAHDHPGRGEDRQPVANHPSLATLRVVKPIAILAVSAGLAAALVAAPGSAHRGRDTAAVRCSASTLPPAKTVAGLTPAVASMRLRIVAAARRCDYAALVRLGNERGRGLAFSYGATTSAAAYWRMLERNGPRPRPMEALVKLLALPYATVALDGRAVPRRRARFYVWPRAHRLNPSARDWQALRVLYTQAQIDAMRRSGVGYLGYRVGITPAGDWQYFIAGD